MNALSSFIAQLGMRRLIAMGLVTALVAGGLYLVTTKLPTTPMGYLFTELEPAQAQEISDKLRGMNIPFELNADGSAVMAPVDKLRELRMQLASQGLSGPIGYELLDNQSALGTTAFLQTINHARAVEGELGRTIATIDGVQDARVHLVLPQRELFDQKERRASASITLKTTRRLAPAQVNAIRQLVASAVPDLDPGQVAIVDQSGTLLARASDAGDASGIVANLQERQISLESKLRQDIETMLERIVGPGRARAEISVELDVEQLRQESEVYDPDKQVVARSTTVERTDQNQDGQQGGAVTVANALPEQQQQGAGGPSSQSASNETSEQVDYANSKTRTTMIKESGAIKRLSVAVIVDGSYTGADTKKSYVPRKAAELEQLTRLVQNAVGYNEERGDSVVVENIRFAEEAAVPEAEDALPMGMEKSDVMRLIEVGVTGLLALIALLFVFRPIISRLLGGAPGAANDNAQPGAGDLIASGEERLALAPPPAQDENDLLAARAAQGDQQALAALRDLRSSGQAKLSLEAEIDVAQIEGRVNGSALKKVGDVVARHPAESAAIVRQWMYSS